LGKSKKIPDSPSSFSILDSRISDSKFTSLPLQQLETDPMVPGKIVRKAMVFNGKITVLNGGLSGKNHL
jgi:hypothetical protein